MGEFSGWGWPQAATVVGCAFALAWYLRSVF